MPKWQGCSFASGVSSALGQLKQAAVLVFVSANYGRSRTSQMLSELFCSSLHCIFALPRDEKKEKFLKRRKLKKKKGKMFLQQVGRQLLVHSTQDSGLLCAIKS
jgi:hypothetical protein